jgi:hypothetical protein
LSFASIAAGVPDASGAPKAATATPAILAKATNRNRAAFRKRLDRSLLEIDM